MIVADIQNATEDEKLRYLTRMRELLIVRMEEVKPRRYKHSLGVARTAAHLAEVYGVDSFLAEAAGLVHDWDKVLDDSELLARAAQYRIRLAGSPTYSTSLLHGLVAAVELPHIFPELPEEVWQAIARHTVAAVDISVQRGFIRAGNAVDGRRVAYEHMAVMLDPVAVAADIAFHILKQLAQRVFARNAVLFHYARGKLRVAKYHYIAVENVVIRRAERRRKGI